MSHLKLILTMASTTATLLGIAFGAVAQTNSVPLSQQSLQEFQQNSSQSNYSIGGSGGSGGINMLQLIHNANLLNGKSPDEVRTGQQESLDTAAKEFRLQQRQKLDANDSALPQK